MDVKQESQEEQLSGQGLPNKNSVTGISPLVKNKQSAAGLKGPAAPADETGGGVIEEKGSRSSVNPGKGAPSALLEYDYLAELEKLDWYDDGSRGEYAYGTYRTDQHAGSDILATLLRFFTWPPSGKYFFTSGYYADDAEGGDMGVEILPTPDHELWVVNLGADVQVEETLKPMFPGAENVTIRIMEVKENEKEKEKEKETEKEKEVEDDADGVGVAVAEPPLQHPMAVVTYKKQAARNKAYKTSLLRKLGPYTLDWVQPTELRIFNVPEDIPMEEIQLLFPSSREIVLEPGSVMVTFENPVEAEAEHQKGIENYEFVDLIDRAVGWKRPHENYVLEVPNTTTGDEILQRVPHAQSIKFTHSGDGGRVAIVSYEDELRREKSFTESVLPKLAPQILKWQRDPDPPTPPPPPPRKAPKPAKQGKVAPFRLSKSINVEVLVKGAANMSPEELASRLWRPPDVGFSNLSSLFKPILYVKDIPKSLTRHALLKMFEGATRVDIKNGVGIVEFDEPIQAARAFHVAHKVVYEGKKLQMTIYEPGFQRKEGKVDRKLLNHLVYY